MNRIVAPVPVPVGTLNIGLDDGGPKSPPIHAQKSSPVKYTRIMAPVPVDIKFNKTRGRTTNQVNEKPHRVQHLKTMKKVTVKRRQSLDRLKDELQTILDNNLEKPNSGVGSTDIAQTDVNVNNSKAREVTSNNIQQYQDELPLQEIPKQMEPCIQPMSPSKSVSVDQDKLGDGRILKYIKQQRIKRKVQLKAERSEKMNLEQARKQRLKELQDKTLKILAENIKHRKTDKKLKTTHSMVVPVPSIGHQGALKHQSVYSNKKPVATKTSVKSKSPTKKKSPQREPIEQMEHVHPQQQYDMKLIDELKQTMQERIEQLSNVIETISNTKLNHLETVTEEERSKSSNEAKMTENNSQFHTNLHQDEELMMLGDEECISQNFIDTLQLIELNRQATKIQACVRGYLQRKLYKKLIIERRPLMLNCQKYAAKSMQTEIIPHWLHHGTLKPCPYNFISAVKRKLNLAVAGRVPYSEQNTSHSSYSDPMVSQKLEDSVMFQIQSISAPELQSPNDISKELPNVMRDELKVISHNSSELPDDIEIQLSDVDDMKPIKISEKQSGSSSIKTSIRTDHYDNTFLQSTSRNDDLNDLNGSVNNIAQSKSVKCTKSDRIFSEKSHSGYNIKLKDKLISDIKTLNDLNTTFSAYNNAANDTSMEISSIHSDIQSSSPERKSRSKTLEQSNHLLKSKVLSELDGSSKLCTNIETISRTRSFIKSDQIVLKSPQTQSLSSKMNSSIGESLKTEPIDETQSNLLTKHTFKNTLSSVTENMNDIMSNRSRQSQQYTSDFDQSKNVTRESQIENLTRPASSLKINHSKFSNGTKYSSHSDSSKSKSVLQRNRDDNDIKTVIKYIENLKSLSKTYLENKVTQTSLKSEEPELVELHNLKNTNQDGFESNSRTLTEMAEFMKHKTQRLSKDDCVSGNVLEDLYIPPLDLSKIKSSRLISSSSEFSFSVGPNAKHPAAAPRRMSYDLRAMSTDKLFENAMASDASTSTIMSSKRVVFTKTHSPPKNNGSADNEYSAVINLDKMIRDEHAKVIRLKAMLRNKEQTLIERTKGEITMLEMRKRQLKINGNLDEIPSLKKKQRGLLLNLQQERSEIEKMKKRYQKTYHDRKHILRNNRHLFRLHLDNHNVTVRGNLTRSDQNDNANNAVMSAAGLPTATDRRQYAHQQQNSGPMKGYDLGLKVSKDGGNNDTFSVILSHREKELQKRRSHVEALLRWSKRLDEKEREITQMESRLGLVKNTADKMIKNNNSALCYASTDTALQSQFKSKERSRDKGNINRGLMKSDNALCLSKGLDQSKITYRTRHIEADTDLSDFMATDDSRVICVSSHNLGKNKTVSDRNRTTRLRKDLRGLGNETKSDMSIEVPRQRYKPNVRFDKNVKKIDASDTYRIDKNKSVSLNKPVRSRLEHLLPETDDSDFVANKNDLSKSKKIDTFEDENKSLNKNMSNLINQSTQHNAMFNDDDDVLLTPSRSRKTLELPNVPQCVDEPNFDKNRVVLKENDYKIYHKPITIMVQTRTTDTNTGKNGELKCTNYSQTENNALCTVVNNKSLVEITKDKFAQTSGTANEKKVKGSDLNRLWRHITGAKLKKYNDNQYYCMSKQSLENFYEEAKMAAIQQFSENEDTILNVFHNSSDSTENTQTSTNQMAVSDNLYTYDSHNYNNNSATDNVESVANTSHVIPPKPSRELDKNSSLASFVRQDSGVSDIIAAFNDLSALLKKRKHYNGNSNGKSLDNFELSLSEENPTTNFGEIHNVEIVQTNENGTISLNSKISRLTSTHSMVLSIRKSENIKDNDVHLSEIPTRPVDDILNAVNDNVNTMNDLETVYSSIINEILDKTSQSVLTAQSLVDISEIRISSAAGSGQNDTSIISSIVDDIMSESNPNISAIDGNVTHDRSSSIKSFSELGKPCIVGQNIQEINKIRRTQSLKSDKLLQSGTKIELIQTDLPKKESRSLDISSEYTVEFPPSVPSLNSAPTEEFIYTPIFSKDSTENSIATDSQAKTTDGSKSSKTDEIATQSDVSEVDAKSGMTSEAIKTTSGEVDEVVTGHEQSVENQSDRTKTIENENTLPTNASPIIDIPKSNKDDSHSAENKTTTDGPRTESISSRTRSHVHESKITENLSASSKIIESVSKSDTNKSNTAENDAKSAELKTRSVELSITKSAQIELKSIVEDRSESISKEYSKSAEYETTSATGTKSSNNQSETSANGNIPGSGTISRELSVENKSKTGEPTSKSVELQTDIDETNIQSTQNDLTRDESNKKSNEDSSPKPPTQSPLRTNETQTNSEELLSMAKQSRESEQDKQLAKIETPENISSDPTSTDPNFILQVPGEVTLQKLDEFLRSDYAHSVCSSHVAKSINSTIDMIYKSNDEVINSDTSGSLILTNSPPGSPNSAKSAISDKTRDNPKEENSSITHKQGDSVSASLVDSNADKNISVSDEYDTKSTSSSTNSAFTHGDKFSRKNFDDLYQKKTLAESGNLTKPGEISHEHDSKSIASSTHSTFTDGDNFERKNFDDLYQKQAQTENQNIVKDAEKKFEFDTKSTTSSANSESTYGGQFDRKNIDDLYLRKTKVEKCPKHARKQKLSSAITHSDKLDREHFDDFYGIKKQMESQITVKPVEKLKECDTKSTTAPETSTSTHGAIFDRKIFEDLYQRNEEMEKQKALKPEENCEESDKKSTSSGNSAFTHKKNFDDLHQEKSHKDGHNIINPEQQYIEDIENADQKPFQFGVIMDKARLLEHRITSGTQTTAIEKSPNVCVKKVIDVVEEINNITFHSLNLIDMDDTIDNDTHPGETFLISDGNLAQNYSEYTGNDLKNGLVKIDDCLKYLNETFEKVPVYEKPMSSPRYESDFESNVYTSDSDCLHSARTENIDVSSAALRQIENASEHYMSENQQNDPEDPFASICISRNMARYATQSITSNGHRIFARDDEPDPENPTTSSVIRQNELSAAEEGFDTETFGPKSDYQVFQTENDPNNPCWSGAFRPELGRDTKQPSNNAASTSHEDQESITSRSKTLLDELCRTTKANNRTIVEGIKDSSRRLGSSVDHTQQKLLALKKLNDIFLFDNQKSKNILERLIKKAAEPSAIITMHRRVSFNENIVEPDDSKNNSEHSENHEVTSKKSVPTDDLSTADVTDKTKASKTKILKHEISKGDYEGSKMPLSTEDLYFDKSIIDVDLDKMLRPHRQLADDFKAPLIEIQHDDKAVQKSDTRDAAQQCLTSVHEPIKKDYEVYIYAGTQTVGSPTGTINQDLLINTGGTNQTNENATQTCSKELLDSNNIEQPNSGRNADEEYQLYLYAGTQSISPENIHFIDPEKDNLISKIYKVIPKSAEQQQQPNLDLSYPSTLQSIESIEHDLDKSLSAIENQLKNDNGSIRITGLINENIIEPIYTNVSKSVKQIDQEQQTSAVAVSANIISVKDKNDVATTCSAIESHPDVKKRVQEILEAAAINKSPGAFNSSPRVQDLWITTNENLTPSPGNSPPVSPHSLSTEAEQLRRKQFEIEQEIKRLQQQSEQMEFYVREIPNKPPPPYTPPPQQLIAQFQDAFTTPSFQPPNLENHPQVLLHTSDIERNDNKQLTKEETEVLIVENTQKLYDAFRTGHISEVDFRESNINEKLVFDLCKEVIIDHFKCSVDVPVWLRGKRILPRHVYYRLEDLTNFVKQKVLQFMNFESDATSVCRLGHKYHNTGRREVKMERNDWKAQDSDYEFLCKENATNCILNMLLSETADVVADTFKKKNNKKS